MSVSETRACACPAAAVRPSRIGCNGRSAAWFLGALLPLVAVSAHAAQAPMPGTPASPPVMPAVQGTAAQPQGLPGPGLPVPGPGDLMQAGQVISLQEAVRIAMANHGSIVVAEENVEAARQRVRQVRTGLLPIVTGSVGYQVSGTSSLGGLFGREPSRTIPSQTPGQPAIRQGIETDNISSNRGLQPRINVDFPILNGGITRANVRQARAGVEQNLGNLGITRNDRAFFVTQDYLAQQRSERLLELRSEQERLAQEQLRSVEAGIQVGRAAEADRALVVSELRNRQVDRIQAENSVRVAANSLRNSMGLTVGPPLRLVELRETDAVPPPKEQLRESAFLARPEVVAAEARVRIQRETETIARINRKPRLDASFSFNLNPNDSFQRSDFLAAVGVSMPLFDWGLTRARELEARAGVRAALADLEQTRKDVTAEVEEAYLNLINARERLDASRLAVRAAQVNLEVTQRRYELGAATVTVVDLIQAQVQFATANNNAISALYDVFFAEAQLGRAVGRNQ